MFLDADLVPYPGFFKDVLLEARLAQLDQHVSRFLMLPVIYLTELGYQVMQEMTPSEWRHFFINAVMRTDGDLIEKCSSGTSVIVVDRMYYLSRGGQDTGFVGWGYEDYEFTNRLIRRDRQFPLPRNWLSMAGNLFTISKFEGWKSVYRLYGDWMAAKGIYLFHAPHPIEPAFHARKDQNMRFLVQQMALDASDALDEPPPLPSMDAGISLLLRKNPFCFDREFAPFLGQCIRASEDDFDDTLQFAEYLKDHQVSRVIFGNPYSNAKIKRLYEWCRAANHDYVVCERGALPESIYHDFHGFLNDSVSYNSANWDRPLTTIEREKTLSYITDIRLGTEALESQSQRRDAADIKKQLGLRRGQKILFVPFQQPNDSVIREFSGAIGSFEGFRAMVAGLVVSLGDEWLVVYKKHPAEDDLLPISGAVSANDTHVYDLLEICDAVALINSGAGIYGMMFGKPVYVFGDSWYSHPGLCRAVKRGEDPAKVIKEGFEFDFELMLKFIHYLRYEFYSFGSMTTRSTRYADGSPITATTAIKYYEIRWGKHVRYLQKEYKPTVTSGPLFDRYKGSSTAVDLKSAGIEPSRSAKAAALDDLEAAANAAFHAKDFKRAAELFNQAALSSNAPSSRYRAAAEAMDRMGDTKGALECLRRASEVAKNKDAILRRIREMSRPKLLRKLLRERPYPIPNQDEPVS